MNGVERAWATLGFGFLSTCLFGQLHAGVPTAPPVVICEPALEIDGHLHCGRDGLQALMRACGRELPALRSGDAVQTSDCRAIARLPGASLEALGAPVDINDASLVELESLPGIGPVLAGRIAAGRPYDRVDDLQRVAGIGPVRLQALRRRARVDVPAVLAVTAPQMPAFATLQDP